jgi:hypothetical protein
VLTKLAAANGREFFGTHPDNQMDVNSETPFGRRLATAVDGLMEVGLPAGRADVMSSTHAFEVEWVSSWRKGAQQAYAYGAMSQLIPALAVMGHTQGLARYLPIIEIVANEMVGLDLWVYDHGTEAWLHCDANATAAIRLLAKQEADLNPPPVQVDQAAVRQDEYAARLAAREAERATWDEDHRRRVEEWEARPRATYPCPHGGEHASKKAEADCSTERAIKVACDGPPFPPSVINELRNLLPPVKR